MYKIKFELGDWSDDGHGKSKIFLVESSVPVEELREIHFKAPNVLGFDIGSICSEYEKNWITKDFYYTLHKVIKVEPNEELDENFWEEYEDKYYFEDVDELLWYWLKCLTAIEPTLELKIVDDRTHPSIHFYGFDSLGRHLNTPGYGLFN